MINIRNEKGITITALIIMIIVMLIISGTTITCVNNYLNTSALTKMQSDISVLQDKILLYYNKYGEVPITGEQKTGTSIEPFWESMKDEFYEINLNALDNLSLNLGYKEEGEDDIYVVNQKNLKVYYLAGIKSSGEMIYSLDGKTNEKGKVLGAIFESIDNEEIDSELLTVALNSRFDNAQIMNKEETIEIKVLDDNKGYIFDKTENDIIQEFDAEEIEYAGDITKGGECDGTEEKPFQIECIEDLIAFSIMTRGGNNSLGLASNNFEDEYVVIIRDLDFNSVFSYNNYPTSTNFVTSGTFNGTLDGQGYKISSITTPLINTNNGTIKNMEIDANIEQSGDKGVLTYTNYGTVEYITISGNSIANGGIAQNNYGTIYRCLNYADIGGGNSLGGIVSNNQGGTISECANFGLISGGGSTAGGIAAAMSSNGIIENCYHAGTINTYQIAAGICGNISGGTIRNCMQNGTSNATWSAGYIACAIGEEANISDCYALDGSSTKRAGALVTTGCTVKTESELKNSSILPLLNANNETSVWKMDTENINNGYPIFTWQ